MNDALQDGLLICYTDHVVPVRNKLCNGHLRTDVLDGHGEFEAVKF